MKFFYIFVLLVSASIGGFGQTYVIFADRLIDGKSDHALPNPTVIVRQGKIIDVNFNRTIPDSAVVIDLTGHTLLPGLMDVQAQSWDFRTSHHVSEADSSCIDSGRL